MAALVLASAWLFTACVDFGLDDRDYRCEGEPEVCGEGWFCNDEGYCEAGEGPAAGADAGADGPEPAHCDEGDAGEVCDDENPCTENACGEDGTCTHEPVPDNTPCGSGCLCEDGEPVDVSCPDQCPSGESCCPDGACRPTC